MKHLLYTLALLALLASCTIEGSDNGDLDGFWHLEKVDTLSTGGTADMSEKRIFWGIQYKLISVRDIDIDGAHGYYLRFAQTADSLHTFEPYKDNWHEDSGPNGGDLPVSDAKQLAPYGINNIEEAFAKEALDGKRMTLKSKTLRLYFKRF